MLTSTPGGVPVLEKRGVVLRHFILALGLVALVGVVIALAAGQGASDRVVGAGSTFAQPLIQRASTHYQTARSGDEDWTPGSAGVDYEPIGSLGGIQRLNDPEVDFAVSDYPLSQDAATKLGYVQFPIAVGGLAPVYNLGGAPASQLKLTPKILADIYLGKITNWSDPAIAAVNLGTPLPDLKIQVVNRADGSGSTLHWTRYLASGNEAWRAAYGAGTTIKWPIGKGVRGSDEMAKTVKATPGAIGYLEAGQARRARLAMAQVENAQKQFVAATPTALDIAARGADWSKPDATLDLAAPDAYPIVTAVYVIMKQRNGAPQDNERALRFITFILDQQGADARSLGYLPLPTATVADIKQIWARDLNYRS